MNAGSGKADVMAGPFEKARFVRGADSEKGVRTRERKSDWRSMMELIVGSWFLDWVSCDEHFLHTV